ncbi:MAG: amino acid-binding ACT domain-containing protein, partial [Candidatus Hodarchaeales archaeon]
MKDLTVILQNKPGTLADMGETLGKAGIPIESLCGFPYEGVGVLHILINDADQAREALKNAGFEVRAERDVLIHTLEERAGSFGELMRKMANAGINVDLVYARPLTHDLVFG